MLLKKLEKNYSAIPFLSIHPKKLKAVSGRDICTPMFIVVVFTIAKSWKQPKCPSCMNGLKIYIFLYFLEYNSVLKWKDILTQATTWINLKDTMLSKINQAQKDKYYMSSHI